MIDDKAFEDQSRRRNQDALSTSNGLALDLRAGTQSSIANGWGCARQKREKAVHRRWRRGGKGKKHTLTCILCSLAKGKSFLKFGCLAEASQWKYRFHTSFKSDRNTAKSRHDKNPVHAGCGYSFSGSQISSSISFSRMSLGVTGAVDYPQ